MKWVTGLSVTRLMAAGIFSARAGGASTTTTPPDVTTKLDWTKPEITTYPASPTLWRRYPRAWSAMGRACSGSGKNCCITFSLSDYYSSVFPLNEVRKTRVFQPMTASRLKLAGRQNQWGNSALIWNVRLLSMNMELLSFSRDRPSSYGSRVHVVLLCYSITRRNARIASDSSASATHSSRYFHTRSLPDGH